MKPDQTFGELKEKLVRCLNKINSQMGNKRELIVEQLRLWKCNYNVNNRDKLADYLERHIGPDTKIHSPQPD